ncbi:MAG: PadR family transcriptional regulator [Thermoanaerobaculia bacterium]|nr:PadR family transcriptional regulator [Thermoanaerobaculia bacterium]
MARQSANDPKPGTNAYALPVVKGTLDLLTLKALWTPMHGFEVTAWIEQQSEGRLQFDDSAIYQALYRLEKKGLLSAEWGVTANNRRARYYRLTPKGREHLTTETERLLRYSETVAAILRSAPTMQVEGARS